MESFGWQLVEFAVRIVLAIFLMPIILIHQHWAEFKPLIPYLILLLIAPRIIRIVSRIVRSTWATAVRSSAWTKCQYLKVCNAYRRLRAWVSRLRSRTTHEEARNTTTSTRTASNGPHEILGVRRGASHDQIKRAYYEAMSKNHPDKVSHLDPALHAVALERTRQITGAYERLMGRAA